MRLNEIQVQVSARRAHKDPDNTSATTNRLRSLTEGFWFSSANTQYSYPTHTAHLYTTSLDAHELCFLAIVFSAEPFLNHSI